MDQVGIDIITVGCFWICISIYLFLSYHCQGLRIFLTKTNDELKHQQKKTWTQPVSWTKWWVKAKLGVQLQNANAWPAIVTLSLYSKSNNMDFKNELWSLTCEPASGLWWNCHEYITGMEEKAKWIPNFLSHGIRLKFEKELLCAT